MSVVRLLAVLLYVAAVLTAASEAGRAVAFLVGLVGAACLALAYAAGGGATDGRPLRRPRLTRRRRRA